MVIELGIFDVFIEQYLNMDSSAFTSIIFLFSKEWTLKDKTTFMTT